MYEQTTSGPTNKHSEALKSVAGTQQRQEKQLIYKHNRQILVETFHKLGRIWFQRFWVTLATIFVIARHMRLVSCVCLV